MKVRIYLASFMFISVFLSGCSTFNLSAIKKISFASQTQNEILEKNPLKTSKDIEIERLLINNAWQYTPQGDDCKDTKWKQSFHKNRYYKSVGDACSIPDAFSVDAENWHIKNKVLYMTNLSPNKGEDIILKYVIAFLDQNKLVLRSGTFTYIFKAVK